MLSRNLRRRILVTGFVLLLSVSLASAETNDVQPFAVRSQNPFTQVFGLPVYPSLSAPEPKRWQGTLTTDVINHADSSATASEAVTLDGETYVVTAALMRNLNDSWSIGIDVPYLWHRDGRLDNFIEDWHDLWGISNANREGNANELLLRYSGEQSLNYILDKQNSGVGDARLWASYQLMNRNEGRSQIMTRVTVKLPTGSSDDLHGSGAADLAWDIAGQRTLHEGRTALMVTAHIGVLLLGEGDVLEALQEDYVAYGGVGIVWKVSSRVDLMAQVYGQGRYFDSDLDEIGNSTIQLTTGFRYRWLGSGTELLAGLVEDLFSDTTPDIGFHFEVRKAF